MKIKISCKSVAKRRNSVKSVDFEYDAPVVSVREFLAETVKINLRQYGERQEISEVLRVLSREKIEAGVREGKIAFGRVSDERKPPALEEAVANALLSFEDGIAVVFIDGKKMTALDEKTNLHEGSEVTFVRMTMLAGRMW